MEGADAAIPAADAGADPMGAVTWTIDDLKSIGGHAVTVRGNPTVIDTPAGKAVQFDGQGDALVIDDLPIATWPRFTAEVLMRPDTGGVQAQRYFHMKENPSEHRVLFETRLFGNNFVPDVFVESSVGEAALYTQKSMFPLGAWYSIAVVVDGQRARSYVNGVEQATANIGFQALKPGRTSLGMRINEKYFFKGALRLARFTPRPLAPDELLKP
jgi:hypothetical protein